MRCQLVHEIPGRVRIRIDEPEVFHFDPAALRAWLEDQPGVRAVRVNAASRSVVVDHDPAALGAERLVARLAGLNRLRLRDLSVAARPHAPAPSPSVMPTSL